MKSCSRSLEGELREVRWGGVGVCVAFIAFFFLHMSPLLDIGGVSVGEIDQVLITYFAVLVFKCKSSLWLPLVVHFSLNAND